MLKLHNTLSGETEEFKSIKAGEVRIYNCGPTVYNYAHIGNLRAYIFADTLRRVLEWNGYKVRQVMNITDVGQLTSDADEGEDKMRKALEREGKAMTMENMFSIGTFYANAFLDDLSDLNIKKPDVMPRASEHIAEDLEIIKKLEEKGIAYKISDGIYFDTSKFAGYGKLGGVNRAELKEGARVGVNPEKKNSSDFTLWKFSTDPAFGWDSPWGKGFPGWHIECSAMSRCYLGQPFDIHTGGVDHIGTHHNNEIAQSEAAFDTVLSNYWMHNGHLNIAGAKMAKSGENFLTLRTLIEKGYSPLAYRYYILGASYRTPMAFSFEALDGAQNTLERLVSLLTPMEDGGSVNEEYLEKLTAIVNDDLNTTKVLSLVWELMRDENVVSAEKKATVLEFDNVLGLDFKKQIANAGKEIDMPARVIDLLKERQTSREEKNWARSDEIRDEIKNLGFEVKDTDSGQKVHKIK